MYSFDNDLSITSTGGVGASGRHIYTINIMASANYKIKMEVSLRPTASFHNTLWERWPTVASKRHIANFFLDRNTIDSSNSSVMKRPFNI